MVSKALENAINSYENHIFSNGVDEELINAYVLAANTAILEEKEIEYGLKISARAKEIIEYYVLKLSGDDIWALERYCQINDEKYTLVDNYYELLKIESYYLFESFIQYMEKDRNYLKRFYQPRRKTLKIVVDDLQKLEDEPIKFQGVSQPSRTGKSTVCILFLCWIALKRPNSHSAMGGH